MALVVGTNCGFVTEAPVVDPDASHDATIDTRAVSNIYTSPATATKIVEIGWYCKNATEVANFEVGVYEDEGNGEPENAVSLYQTNAKGTGAGWKVVAVDITISPNTNYWLAIQLDDTSTTTKVDRHYEPGVIPYAVKYSPAQTTLLEDWGTSNAKTNNDLIAIYAVWEAAPIGFTRKIKISGTFQDKPIKTKVSGTFEDKPIKIKVGGTFQDA